MLYVIQGTEANIDLAVQKTQDYRDVQLPFDQVDYKFPGKTMMSKRQYYQYIS